MKSLSTEQNKEDYKYSTPLEGPDNQFGSADTSDDEDERETSTDVFNKMLITASNDTANKTLHLTRSNAINKLNLSNKVKKITNKFDINYQNNACKNYNVQLILILSFLLKSVLYL